MNVWTWSQLLGREDNNLLQFFGGSKQSLCKEQVQGEGEGEAHEQASLLTLGSIIQSEN